MQNVTNPKSRDRHANHGREHEMGDDSLIQIVWRQRALVGLVTAAVLLIAGVYLLIASPVYTAASRIQVARAVPISDRQPVAVDSGNSDTFLYQEAELIKSVPILSMVLGGPSVEDMQILEGVDRPMAFLKRELDVEVGKKDGLISISLSSKYKDEAKQLVDDVVESYKAFKAKQRRETASGVMAVLEKDKEKTDALLASKYDDNLKFKQDNNTLSFDGDKSNYIMQRANSMADALTTAHIDAINLKTAYDAALKSIVNDDQAMKDLDKGGGVILSQQDEDLLRAELFSRQQELAERKRIYLPDHPIIKALEARIEQENVAYVASAKLRWEAAQQQETELQKSFDDQQKLAMDMSKKAAEYSRLQNDITQLQKHSDDLDTRIKDVTLTLDSGAMNITVIDEANWEDQPIRPQKMQVLGIALCLGLLLGSVCAVGREWYDPRLRSETEVKTAIGVPVLGAIPHFPGANSPEALGWAVHLDPQSEAAEAYRTVRTSLQFGVADGEARTIVVTSPSPRDGKSTLSSNLAIAMAKAGKTVLIIDSDFRSPSQHRIFGVSGEVGFSSVLESGEVVDRAIRRTTIEGLHVMPAGPAVGSPSELLNSAALNEILDGLAKQYDHVVIDTPPVSRVDDARIVAASCDATILVLRADKSNRKLAEESRDRLMAVGARILGVVLNDISGTGGSGLGGLPGLLRSEGRESEQQNSADDVLHHASVRPVTGSGRMM
ncbi:MAG TPA: polysaccharide biosynthesis tyrosine autokinase [Tepidisphaeraceae bacterium]|nr:polysaccharide biosynthesis tyrosine autokinase [Tepidisphaeraceae bacterium]